MRHLFGVAIVAVCPYDMERERRWSHRIKRRCISVTSDCDINISYPTPAKNNPACLTVYYLAGIVLLAVSCIHQHVSVHHWHLIVVVQPMMTSSNGNIFRVTGHLRGEFTGPGEFPTQRPVTRSFDVFFDLRLNKRLSKQSWGWWFETLSRPLWRHCNATICVAGSHFINFFTHNSNLIEILLWLHPYLVFRSSIFCFDIIHILFWCNPYLLRCHPYLSWYNPCPAHGITISCCAMCRNCSKIVKQTSHQNLDERTEI